MANIHCKSWAALMVASLLSSGCGLTERFSDGARSMFYPPVKTLHLDFTARTLLNSDANSANALSMPTLVRVYQLRDSQAWSKAGYTQLLDNDSRRLNSDVLAQHQVVVKPGEAAQLSVPLAAEARLVAVVGLFRSPDLEDQGWKLVLTRDQLQRNRARVIELRDRALSLHAEAGEDS